jgi:hypothetical protein
VAPSAPLTSSAPQIATPSTPEASGQDFVQDDAGDGLVDLWGHIYGEQAGVLCLVRASREPGEKSTTFEHEYFSWPGQAEQAAAWVATTAAEGYDVYHGAHLYTVADRGKQNAAPVAALWTDDDGAPPLGDVPPTARVETSPGSTQSYYRLTEPVDAELAEQLTRRLTYAMGADVGGWGLAKLLRPPGTQNHKYPETPPVRLVQINPEAAYDPAVLAMALPPLPELAQANPNGRGSVTTRVELPDDLPVVDVSSLHVSGQILELIEKGVPMGERSQAVRRVECALIKSGYDDPTIASVLLDHGNGISDKPLECGRQWVADDIERARGFMRDLYGDEFARPSQDPPPAVQLDYAPPAAVQAPSEPQGFLTLADLTVPSHQEQKDWILPGYIARQSLTMLAGAAGVGKGAWLFALARAAEAGDPFLERPVPTTPMVLLTEESPPELRAKAGLVGLRSYAHCIITVNVAPGSTWEEYIDHAARIAVERGLQLLVIDSFTFWARLEADQENDAAAITARLRYLRQVAIQDNLAVVIIHHTGRGGGIRGSTAFEEQCSVVFKFRKRPAKEGGRPTQRVLQMVKSRFAETPAELVIDFNPTTGRYDVAGHSPSVSGAVGRGQPDVLPGGSAEPSTGDVPRSKQDRFWLVIPLEESGALDEKALRVRYQQRWNEPISHGTASGCLDRWVTAERVQQQGSYPARFWRHP